MSESENSTTKKPALKGEDLTRMLELRSQLKKRTPNFRRFESWRYVRIDESWRKPKGVDNHMRLSVKGWPHLVKIGYRVPKNVRYLHPSGYRDVLVHNLVELESLSPDSDAARFASGIGKRKRIVLSKRAKELGIKVLNRGGLYTKKQPTQEEQEKEEKSKADKKRKD